MVETVNHVALMRNVELVVKYLPGPVATAGRNGYSGVFRCAVDVDATFRRAEPPTHDDWIYRAIPSGHDRTFVKVALDRIADVCREAAGYHASMRPPASGDAIPLGEFADALAVLMPGADGPGARRRAIGGRAATGRKGTVRQATLDSTAEVWVDGTTPDPQAGERPEAGEAANEQESPSSRPRPAGPPPQVRSGGAPRPAIASDGSPVIRYPFEVRGRGNRFRLRAVVEVMTSDGGQVEPEAPVGYTPPSIRAWTDPTGTEHRGEELIVGPDEVDGTWSVDVPIDDEAVMRVDIIPEVA